VGGGGGGGGGGLLWVGVFGGVFVEKFSEEKPAQPRNCGCRNR